MTRRPSTKRWRIRQRGHHRHIPHTGTSCTVLSKKRTKHATTLNIRLTNDESCTSLSCYSFHLEEPEACKVQLVLFIARFEGGD
jgi:hypothetical protein